MEVDARQEALANLLRVTVLDNPYIPHDPTPKQAELLLAPEREVFFGGAVGGGKSDALLMAALQYVQVPGYSAIIFRRTLSDLTQSDGLIPRSHDWLGATDAHWNGNEYAWTFPSGARVEFGYMRGPNDHLRYKSAAYIRQLWEELTTFTEQQYTYVQSRSRRAAGFPIPIQTYSASNPDGPGAEWVAERFVGPDEDGVPQPGHAPPGRRFIPAGLDDNPHLDTEEYEQQLDLLDVISRQQLRHGRWGLTAKGGQFDRTMVDVVESAPPGLRKVRGWDFAATEPQPGQPDPDWTRGVLWGTKGGEYWVIDMVGKQTNDPEGYCEATAAMDGKGIEVAIPQDPGQAGKTQVKHVAKRLVGHTVHKSPESGSKLVRARPWLAACNNGLVHVVRGPWNRAWFAECEGFPNAPHDDIPDGNSRAFNALARAAKGSIGSKPKKRIGSVV